mmetsp:Transcript_28988/g.85752  ORF Transcript_28988/g.85752 Transcript_28988/m.85752 type:complete len:99 (+) Transcript_28988:201-497(+)
MHVNLTDRRFPYGKGADDPQHALLLENIFVMGGRARSLLFHNLEVDVDLDGLNDAKGRLCSSHFQALYGQRGKRMQRTNDNQCVLSWCIGLLAIASLH